jgi:uncharacterized protein YqjF (DUF2071 family)
MDQRWTDAVFLHWRLPEFVAGSFMPPGVVPDSFDGSAWVGLIGFRMQGAGLGRGPGIPYFGSFNEINVRLYSREPDGTRGVVFLSLDASRLAVVLAARAAGIPYVWSRAGFRGAERFGPEVQSAGYWVRRFRGGAGTDFAVAPDPDAEATDPLSVHLTARFGLHTRFRGRTLYVPNTHSAWPLHRAQLIPVRTSLLQRPVSTSTGRPSQCCSPPASAPNLAGRGS